LPIRIALPRIGDVALFLLLLTLVAPYVPLGWGIAVRIEMLWLPMLLIVALRVIRIPRTAWLLTVFWLWLAVATALTLGRGANGSLNLTAAIGYWRPIVVTILFYSLRIGPTQLTRILRWFVYLAIPLGALAVGQAINLDPVVRLTLAAYSGSSRVGLDSQLAVYGRLSRATGAFEAPSFAAAYFLLAIGTCLWLLSGPARHFSRASRALLIAGAVSALLGGVMTLSSTFIAGLAALIMVLMLTSPWNARVRLIAGGVVTVAVTIPLFLNFIGLSPVAAGSLNYQLARLGSLNVFATRFGDQGLLVPTIVAINQMPLIGWGFFSQPGIFLGDSAYIVWLYLGGSIGLMLMLIILGHCAIQVRTLGTFRAIIVIWLVVLLATGFGSPSFSIPRIGDWWWALAAITAAGAKRWRGT